MPMTDKHAATASHLDAAIDRAVREMMSVEPRADLRERVLAELVGEPARAALWPRLAFGSAAVAVAAVVLLMIVNRPPDQPVDRTIAGRDAARPRRPETQARPAKLPGAKHRPVHVDVTVGPRRPHEDQSWRIGLFRPRPSTRASRSPSNR